VIPVEDTQVQSSTESSELSEVNFGWYEFERETPGTVRYTAKINGRKDTKYMLKSQLPTPFPRRMQIVGRY